MKLILMADNNVGTKIADWLLQYYQEDIVAVVTTSENSIFKSAKDKNIPAVIFSSSEQICEFMDKNSIDPDLGILAWWPSIIKQPLISKPKHGFINTHPSYLPYNRGKHYNFWSLVEQTPFGVTLHEVETGIDSGAIVAQKRIDYDWQDNGGTLHKKANEAMFELFKNSYPNLRSLNFNKVKQDSNAGSFHLAKEIDSASKIDLDKEYKARDLLNLLRARTFDGYPSCWFIDGDKYEVRIDIKKVENGK